MGKQYFLTLATAVALTLSVLSGCATKQERAEQLAKTRLGVLEALAKRQLRIEIHSMNTMRYGSKMVTPDFYLELHGDILRSYLPYMGRAYQAPMASPSQGLNFETVVKSCHQSSPKADLTRLDIEAKTQEDIFVYNIDVYHTGKAVIYVRPQHRDPVNFDGEVVQ